MDKIQRRAFMKGAAIGALAFTIGDADVMLTPCQARAQHVPLRTLTADQAVTLEAMGEALVLGAKDAGIGNFVDQQISIPAEEALLEVRIRTCDRLTQTSTAPRSVRSMARVQRAMVAATLRSSPATSSTSSST